MTHIVQICSNGLCWLAGRASSLYVDLGSPAWQSLKHPPSLPSAATPTKQDQYVGEDAGGFVCVQMCVQRRTVDGLFLSGGRLKGDESKCQRGFRVLPHCLILPFVLIPIPPIFSHTY